MSSSDGEIRAALRAARLHVPDSCHGDLLDFLATAADPTVHADQKDEAIRAEREEIERLVAEVEREVGEQERKSRRAHLAGSRRRIVRLRPRRRPHDPLTNSGGTPDGTGEAA
ncbi:MAG: hypothetical protein GEU98_18670 [Pseudonocardiaceae bacterium]|nr:hypothetical protein [Pseudonocardiaceae bacterium]